MSSENKVTGFFVGMYLRHLPSGEVVGPRSFPRKMILWTMLLIFLFCFYDLLASFINVFYVPSPISPWDWAGQTAEPITGLTFNSMLLHMIDGRFDVDPAVVGSEAFVRGGTTYAYFGVLPALLRLPLLPFVDLETTDVTIFSCVIAACIAALAKVNAVITIGMKSPPSRIQSITLSALTLTIVFGGSQIQFLKPSVYQEAASWAGALASVFVLCSVIGLIRGRFSTFLLVAMAVISGLALLCRVSTGLGLYVGLGLLLLSHIWLDFRVATLIRIISPVVVLLSFAMVCGVVNYERWGNPLIFMPVHLNLFYAEHPYRLALVDEYGEFNIKRVWYGLMYYFVPVWTIIRADGHTLFHEFQQRMMDGSELPISSFFVSDPLLLALSGIAVFGVWGQRVIKNEHGAALLIGLAVSPILMLTAMYMAFRYRIEFYPFFELSAFLGAYFLLASQRPINHFWIKLSTWLGIVSSFILLAIYKISPFGDMATVETALKKAGGLIALYKGLIIAIEHFLSSSS